MPAVSASLCTVCTSQYSVVPSEPSMTFAPTDILAMNFEIRSEMKAPPKPKIADSKRSDM